MRHRFKYRWHGEWAAAFKPRNLTTILPPTVYFQPELKPKRADGDSFWDSQIVRDLVQHGKRRMFVMAGVPLRDDFDGGTVRAVAKTAKNGPQVRRPLALAAMRAGAARRRGLAG